MGTLRKTTAPPRLKLRFMTIVVSSPQKHRYKRFMKTTCMLHAGLKPRGAAK